MNIAGYFHYKYKKLCKWLTPPRLPAEKRLMDRVKNLQSLDLLKDYLDPGVRNYGVNYAENGFKEDCAWYRERLEEFDLYDFKHVVDVGCGFGRWSFFLAEGNKHVTGYDNSEGLINIANNLNRKFGFDNLEFHVADAVNLPLESGSVDAVFLHSVTFRIGRKELFNEVRRILKPGGVVFVGEFNSKGKMIWRLCTGYTRGGFEHHLFKDATEAINNGPLDDGSNTYATNDSLDQIVGKYGFQIDYKYPIKDMVVQRNTPVSLDLLNDLPVFLDKFVNDETFRTLAVNNVDTISKVVENNLYFRMIAR